jgi:O-antigen/teichoic acid export membrane protein
LVIFSGLLWGLGILASLLIPALVGERYAAAVPIFLVLLPTRIALIPLVPLSLLFFATDRTRAGALFGAVQLAVLGGAALVLLPTYGALGMAWAKVLVTVAAAAYLVVFAWPYLWSPSRPLGQPASSE